MDTRKGEEEGGEREGGGQNLTWIFYKIIIRNKILLAFQVDI